MDTPLSVLDFGYINPPELYAHQTINSLFEEVAQYESLGYKRLWLSEHYSSEFAWFNPEILLPLLAGYSEKIKIGLAGVLLSYHSPLRVAQNFKILSAVYSDRIDLGIARAHVPPNTGEYLVHKAELENIDQHWEDKVAQLMSFLRQHDPKESLLENMVLPPHGAMLPDVWMLGSSRHSINNAVRHQCNFCISFTHPQSDAARNMDAIKIFKEKYHAQHGVAPHTAALISCVHVKNKSQKEQLEKIYNQSGDVNIFGERGFITDRLYYLKDALHADEFILSNPYADRKQRLESFATIING